MGNSADADVIYGFVIGGEGYPGDDPFSSDWEERYADACGYPEPTIPYESSSQAKAEHRAYWDKKHDLVEAAKCEVVSEGSMSDGYTTEYVTHRGPLTRCSWDSPTELDLQKITPKPEWDKELREFCDVLGIPWQQPKLMIICSYG